MTSPNASSDGHQQTWQERLAFYVETAREMSRQTEPQRMVEAYGNRMRALSPYSGSVSLSRRGLTRPDVRVTRASIWSKDVNPWTADSPVIHRGGLFSRLIWSDEVTIIDDLVVADEDPAAPFCAGMRSLVAIPLFDQGVALNMVIVMRRETSFDREALPERVMMSNLFGRATHNLVLSDQLKHAYEQLDGEMQVVASIQRSLLPAELPRIPGMDLSVYYRTSRRAGGDYYDFFPLPNGQWGILIADVSGHGTPAAVLMAVTHSIAHTHHGPPTPPSALMNFVNLHLAARYTNGNGTFVTALYGIYDPPTRELTYACAGHCPPRVRRTDGTIESRFTQGGLPLGIDPDERYADGLVRFSPGELLVLYTDGVTEARGVSGSMFSTEMLDRVVESCSASADAARDCILSELDHFTSSQTPNDDQTLLVSRFS
jgi:sigma-B regulation protein RsbU (phosphoserine phosphatase)